MTMHMPMFGKVLHKAELYDQLVAKTQGKPKPAPQEAPVTRITATKATANKDPDKMSVDEWKRWREAQVKRR